MSIHLLDPDAFKRTRVGIITVWILIGIINVSAVTAAVAVRVAFAVRITVTVAVTIRISFRIFLLASFLKMWVSKPNAVETTVITFRFQQVADAWFFRYWPMRSLAGHPWVNLRRYLCFFCICRSWDWVWSGVTRRLGHTYQSNSLTYNQWILLANCLFNVKILMCSGSSQILQC